MTLRATILTFVFPMFVTFVGLEAAAVSRQQADVFAKKIAVIALQGDTERQAKDRRTLLTESEVNSWFVYRSAELLPKGVTAPQVTILGKGKVAGQAVVDLDAVAQRRSSGGLFDPWSYLGGRVPLTVAGILHTKDGQGRFEVESAEVSGVPVPKTLLQELVGYYSRSPERPQGIRLDDPFELPANIHHIEVGEGQAVVVQ
jgi:hypothetical protein